MPTSSRRGLFALSLTLLILVSLSAAGFAQIIVGPAPPSLTLVSVSPASVTGGSPATGTVIVAGLLSGTATVALTSSSPAVSVPELVPVTQGTGTSAAVQPGFTPALARKSFAITTSAVTVPTTATITATYSGVSKTTTLTVTPAPPVLTSIVVSPATATLTTGGTQAFTAVAKDQNGTALAAQPPFTWTSTGVGIITSAGVYSAGTTAGTATVRAASGTVSGTATVTVNVAPTVPAYLSNLTLGSTTVIGGGTVIGTVTLSSPAPADVVVALQSSNGAATVPLNRTISAGATQTNFNITTNSVSAGTPVTLTGAYNGWTQSANLTVLPASQAFNVQGLNFAPGNSCALLFWTDLPDGSIRGYNIYRVSGTTSILLNSSLLPSPLYADTGLSNGMTYQYAVSAVDFQGLEHALCSPISVVPSATLGVLSWGTFPSPITDFVNLYASLDSSAIPSHTILLVDGREFGSGDSPAITTGNSSSVSGNVEAGLDTTGLSNGNHVVQLLGWLDGNTVCATPPQIISVSNTVSNFNCDDTIDPGDVAQINATLSSSASWTVSITNEDTGSVVRTWQGASALLHLTWDGTDSAGNQVPEGTYSADITAGGTAASATSASPNSAGSGVLRLRLYRYVKAPQGLALIDKIASDTTKDETLKVKIQADFNKMAVNNPGFIGYAMTAGIKTRKSRKFKVKLVNWLTTSVVDLYVSSHGYTAWSPNNTSYNHLEMHYGDCVLFAPQATPGSKVLAFQFGNDKNHFVFDVSNIMQYRQQHGYPPYNFVMMDGCNQGGGTPLRAPQGKKGVPIDLIGPVNNLWGNIFQVGTDPGALGGCYLGWNGDCVTNDTPDWLNWRIALWDGLAVNGETVQLAINQANATLHPPYLVSVTFWDGSAEVIEPNDQNRLNAFMFPSQTLLP